MPISQDHGSTSPPLNNSGRGSSNPTSALTRPTEPVDPMPDLQSGPLFEPTSSTARPQSQAASGSFLLNSDATEELQSQLEDSLRRFERFDLDVSRLSSPADRSSANASSREREFFEAVEQLHSTLRWFEARNQELSSARTDESPNNNHPTPPPPPPPARAPTSSSRNLPQNQEYRRGIGFPTGAPRIRRAAAILSRHGTVAQPRHRSESPGREQRPAEFPHALRSWTGDVGPNDTTRGSSARAHEASSQDGGSAVSRAGRRPFERSGRMDPQDNAGVPAASSHDYAGWAPGTNASEHSRPTLHTLRAMASRHQNMRPYPTVNTSAYRSGTGTSSLERRYLMERQRLHERLTQDAGPPPVRPASEYERNPEPYYPPTGGFASTVVDAEGNPIDTGAGTETSNPRSIVYNPPPRTREPSLFTYDDQRINDLAFDIDQIERRLATAADPGIRAQYEAAYAQYTQMQRQERMERIERHQRAYFRQERLRRAGASTAEGGNSSSRGGGGVGGGRNPLDELRRGLYELNRDGQSPATPPSASSSDATCRWIESAIRYLHRIHRPDCEDRADRLRAAEEEGFDRKVLDQTYGEDFMLEPKSVGKIPETSWLTPGAVFSGKQRAVTATLPPPPLPQYAATHRERLGRAGIPDLSYATRPQGNGEIELRSITSREPYTQPPIASERADRPVWAESYMQRDRHTGMGISGPALLDTATRNSIERLRSSRVALSGAGLSSPSPTASGTSSSSAVGTGYRSRSTDRPVADGEEAWPVKVTITSVDYTDMTLTGTMEAMNVPSKDPVSGASRNQNNNSSGSNGSGSGDSERKDNSVTGNGDKINNTITTFLEGEIIDLQKYSLETRGYKASSAVDSTYWRRLEPFKSLDDVEIPGKMLNTRWLQRTLGREYILMRWKEKCFVTPSEDGMGLTISGFYYISLHRESGRIEGLYFDPKSTPYQHLCLSPEPMRHLSTYTFQ